MKLNIRQILFVDNLKRAVFLALLLFGCSTITPEQNAYLTVMANMPIYCESGEDCEVKWGRALMWVTRNSYWKIRVQTNDLITTEGPFDTVYAAYQIQKVPLGNNRYEIVMNLGCGNPFGCVPSLLELKADFVQFVNVETKPKTLSEESPIDKTEKEVEKLCGTGFLLKKTPGLEGVDVWECIKECEKGKTLIYSVQNFKWECKEYTECDEAGYSLIYLPEKDSMKCMKTSEMECGSMYSLIYNQEGDYWECIKEK